MMSGSQNSPQGEDAAAQADRCRRLAAITYDREVSKILHRMADGYEKSAGDISGKREA